LSFNNTKWLKTYKIYIQKKTPRYKESNSFLCKKFTELIENINKDDIFYFDETGVDDNESIRYGRSKIGDRVLGLKKGFRKTRETILGFCNYYHKFIDVAMFNGYTNSEVFILYLRRIASIQKRKIYLILDNASFHKNIHVLNEAEKLNIILLFLPPYSPFLNKIENLWGVFKQKIRKTISFFYNFREAICNSFEELAHLFVTNPNVTILNV
jgi:isftu1 transposase